MCIIRAADGPVVVGRGMRGGVHRSPAQLAGVLGLASRVTSSPQLAGAVIGTNVSACFGFLAWERNTSLFLSFPFLSYINLLYPSAALTGRSFKVIWIN